MHDDEPAAIAQQVAAIGTQIPDAELPSTAAPAQAAPPAHLIDEARRAHRELGYALERLRAVEAQQRETGHSAEENAIRAALLALRDAGELYYEATEETPGGGWTERERRYALRAALDTARAAIDPPAEGNGDGNRQAR